MKIIIIINGQRKRNEISVKFIDKTTEGCVDYNLKIMDNGTVYENASRKNGMQII